jgi:hypothetical protein
MVSISRRRFVLGAAHTRIDVDGHLASQLPGQRRQARRRHDDHRRTLGRAER